MKRNRFKLFYARHRKLYLIILIALLVLGLGAVVSLRWLSSRPVNRTDPNGSGSAAESIIKIVPSPLTGEPVSSELAKRPVTGVMIENSPQARPQSGLNVAGVVFEAIAEGGITRFLALYQEARPNLIGPVRSVRPYYIDWAMGYQASIAHVGGSTEGLKQIRTMPGARDLDQFSGGSYFFRSSDRYAPHNMYTRSSLLDEFSKRQGYKTSKFDPAPRKKAAPAKTPTAKSITADFSSNLFKVNYTYRAKSNDYVRSMGGVAHVDRESRKQLSSDVVVVMKVDFSLHANGRHSVIGTVGSGEALVFQDGKVTKGTWRKPTRTEMITLKNGEGKDIKLNPGQTWYLALPKNKTVTYE